MNEEYDYIVAEVRRHREELLEEHGGFEGYMKFVREQQAQFEAEGWKFADLPVDPIVSREYATPVV